MWVVYAYLGGLLAALAVAFAVSLRTGAWRRMP